MLNANQLIGTHDVLFITIDALRYDVAVRALESGGTPNLKAVIPGGRWEERHTPGNFTYAAHQAFFAGFLPTPVEPGKHERLFAARFPGSETTSVRTCVFEEAEMVSGLKNRGYHTICIGGVGFFNMRSELGSQLPGLFHEAHWSKEFGVTDPNSTEHQVNCAIEKVGEVAEDQRVFLFINLSSTHQPNCIFMEGATEDSVETQIAALKYTDKHLGRLFKSMRDRSKTVAIVCSDHGTAYGEAGYWGHRVCHSVVWTVPYAEFVL